MVERSPELITVQTSKSKRRGRVFADWLRNASGQTIAAPYSARRLPGGAVSAPIEWDELDTKLDPSDFNVLTMEQRIEAKDPWAEFWKFRQVLPDLG